MLFRAAVALGCVALCLCGDSYDRACDEMMSTAQQAGRYFNSGDTRKADKAVAKVERLFNKAKEMLPDEPQAYITYATFLLNANMVEKSEAVWREVKGLLKPELIENNPGLVKYVNSRIHKCKYARVSMSKDKVYDGGKGDMLASLELQDEQIQLRPLPELYHARGTVKVQISTTDETLVISAINDFNAAQEAALKGHLAALNLMGQRTARTYNSSSNMQPFFAKGTGTREEYSFPVTIHTATSKTSDTAHYEVEHKTALVRDSMVLGRDAVVTSTQCAGEQWGLKMVTKKLAALYTHVGDATRAKNAKAIVEPFMPHPGKLASAIREKYGNQLEDHNTDWLDEWSHDVSQGCVGTLYDPTQGGRVDLSTNVPVLDVFGEQPDIDQNGNNQFLTFPRQPSGKHKKAILTAQFAGTSFYHFVVEILPRFVMILEDENLQDDKLLILIPQDTSSNKFVKGFLKLMPKLNMKRLRAYTGDVLVDELHVPTWANEEFVAKTHPPASLLKKVRKAIVKEPQPKRDTIVYLSRKGAGMRGLVDDDVMFSRLEGFAKERGMECVKYSTPLSVSETRDLFQRAAVVVGVHGGAMSNTIFCQPETLVVELGFTSPFSFDFVHLSGALDLVHHIYLLDPTPNGMGAPLVSVNFDSFFTKFADLIPRQEEL